MGSCWMWTSCDQRCVCEWLTVWPINVTSNTGLSQSDDGPNLHMSITKHFVLLLYPKEMFYTYTCIHNQVQVFWISKDKIIALIDHLKTDCTALEKYYIFVFIHCFRRLQAIMLVGNKIIHINVSRLFRKVICGSGEGGVTLLFVENYWAVKMSFDEIF